MLVEFAQGLCSKLGHRFLINAVKAVKREGVATSQCDRKRDGTHKIHGPEHLSKLGGVLVTRLDSFKNANGFLRSVWQWIIPALRQHYRSGFAAMR